MSLIKSVIAKDTATWVAFPDLEGFEVKIHYVTREDLLKIRNASLIKKFDKSTRKQVEDIDNDRFVENYAKLAIADWKGLKLGHLPHLLPVDLTGQDLEADVPFSSEEALELLKNSPVFDQFISETLADLESFSVKQKQADSKN